MRSLRPRLLEPALDTRISELGVLTESMRFQCIQRCRRSYTSHDEAFRGLSQGLHRHPRGLRRDAGDGPSPTETCTAAANRTSDDAH
jgi:hypothetical protein